MTGTNTPLGQTSPLTQIPSLAHTPPLAQTSHRHKYSQTPPQAQTNKNIYKIPWGCQQPWERTWQHACRSHNDVVKTAAQNTVDRLQRSSRLTDGRWQSHRSTDWSRQSLRSRVPSWLLDGTTPATHSQTSWEKLRSSSQFKFTVQTDFIVEAIRYSSHVVKPSMLFLVPLSSFITSR